MKMKKNITKILALTLAVVALVALTACSGSGGSAAPAKAVGSYDCQRATIWFDEYAKNLIGDNVQTLTLFDNGTYVLTSMQSVVANMDVEIVTGAPYNSFYMSKMCVTGKYEVTSPADEFGSMQVKLVDAELVDVYGNFEIWALKTDDGSLNFSLSINNTIVDLDASVKGIVDPIEIYALNQ